MLTDDQVDNYQIAGDEAQQAGVDPALVANQMKQESGGQSHVTSSAGAQGPMQLMSGTAKDLGVDPNDPQQNIHGGVTYLKRMLDKYGDTKEALMAYNWGPGNVDKWLAGGSNPESIPAETKQYVNNILNGSHTNNVFNPISDANASETPQVLTDDQVDQMAGPQQHVLSDADVDQMGQPDQGAVQAGIGSLGHNSILNAPLDAIAAEAHNLVNGSGFSNNWDQVRQQGNDQYNTAALQHPTATAIGDDAAQVSNAINTTAALGGVGGVTNLAERAVTNPGISSVAEQAIAPNLVKAAVNAPGAAAGAALGHVGGLAGEVLGAGLGGGKQVIGSLGSAALTAGARGLQGAGNAVLAAPKVATAVAGIGLSKAMSSFTPISADTITHPIVAETLGKFAAPLQSAAQRSPEALAATDFQMQQTYPEYREKLQELSDKMDQINEQQQYQGF